MIHKHIKMTAFVSQDSTLRLWNIEKMERIPSVIESRKEKGSRIAQVVSIYFLTTPHTSSRNKVCILKGSLRLAS